MSSASEGASRERRENLTRALPSSTPGILATAVVAAAIAAALGTVTYSGGIDGGWGGIALGLGAAFLGATGFFLSGGVTAWAFFAVPYILVSSWLTLQPPEGDQIGAVDANLNTAWLWGGPAAVILPVLLIVVVLAIRSRQRTGIPRSGEETE